MAELFRIAAPLAITDPQAITGRLNAGIVVYAPPDAAPVDVRATAVGTERGLVAALTPRCLLGRSFVCAVFAQVGVGTYAVAVPGMTLRAVVRLTRGTLRRSTG